MRPTNDDLVDANALHPGQTLLVAIWAALIGHMTLGALIAEQRGLPDDVMDAFVIAIPIVALALVIVAAWIAVR